MRKYTAALLMFALISSSVPAHAWGNEGHTRINRVAAMKLPKSMPLFFRQAVDRLGYLGPEPDRWRNKESEPALKYAQEPDHFIDMERIPADFGELPVDRHLYIRRLYEFRAKALAAGMDPKKADELLPEKVGYQPYIAMEMMGRLRVAFREYRHALRDRKPTRGIEANIILYAGWLGHYVGDGSQPLHTSVNYDGWVQSNPSGYRAEKGIHWDFEGPFAAQFSEKDFAPMVQTARRLPGKPRDAYMEYLKASLLQVEKLYQLEKAGAFFANDKKGTAEGRDFTKQRLAAGAQMLANMWLTAWEESAVDPPDPYATPVQMPTKKQ